MALTEHPADWKFVAPLPEAKDMQSRLSKAWTLDVKEPVSRGTQLFPLVKPLVVTAESRRIPEGAEILIKIDTEVATECRRCCAPLTVAIHEEFMYSYLLQAGEAESAQEEEEFCSSDRVIIPVASASLRGIVRTSRKMSFLSMEAETSAACSGGSCAPSDQ